MMKAAMRIAQQVQGRQEVSTPGKGAQHQDKSSKVKHRTGLCDVMKIKSILPLFSELCLMMYRMCHIGGKYLALRDAVSGVLH